MLERCDAFAPALLAAYTGIWLAGLDGKTGKTGDAEEGAEEKREGRRGLTRSFVREALCAYGREVVVAPEFWGGDMGAECKAVLVGEGVAVLRAVGESESEMDEGEVVRGVRYLAPMVDAS